MAHITLGNTVYIRVEDVTAGMYNSNTEYIIIILSIYIVRGVDFIADPQITIDHKSGELIGCTNISIPYNDDNESDESFRLRIILSPVNSGVYAIGMVNIATVTIKNGENFIF